MALVVSELPTSNITALSHLNLTIIHDVGIVITQMNKVKC